ncbi:MAG: hypothetical protein K2N05_05110 [Muribaculaceae bacterium]|nr:hypothetical protein [Muribaculaceae bacterium]
MSTTILKSVLFSVSLLGAASLTAGNSPSLSEMTSAEIISMIPESVSVISSNADSNSNAIVVSGEDLLTKAYGALPAVNSFEETMNLAEDVLNMTPTREDGYLWLDSADGYNINYKGMTPDVSALVRLENDSISDYGFFFLFPYSEISKGDLDSKTRFSSMMLEDFENIGVDMGANSYTSDLFEVNGDYSDNFMAMRLIDDKEGERYILLLSVEPNAITPADKVLAE